MGISNKKILGIITARGGSRGIPGKNIKILGGKPLIAYTIETALMSSLMSDIIVSTEDKNIADIARSFGAEVPFYRPAELATDTTGHLEVVTHALNFMEDIKGKIYDYVVILQPTSPFRKIEDIDETIKKIIHHNADSAFSMYEIEPSYHPIKIKKMEGDKVFPYALEEQEGLRRQDLPVAYKRSGAVYVTKRDLIIKEGRLFGDNLVGHLVPKDRSIDIDTEIDWLVAEYMYKKLKDQNFWDDKQ